MKRSFGLQFKDSQSATQKSKVQNLKWVGALFIAIALTLHAVVLEAQQPEKVHRTGLLIAARMRLKRRLRHVALLSL